MWQSVKTKKKVKAKKKRITRKKAGKKSSMYFHEGTTAAIEDYQGILCNDCVYVFDQRKNINKLKHSCPVCSDKRSKIYINDIKPAFEKLVENLVFIHGFRGLHDSYDDLKCDCVSFLYEAISKFDMARGTKPFSYFNVVAKNWLIIRSKQRVLKIKRNVSIDDELLKQSDRNQIEEHSVAHPPDEVLESLEFISSIYKMLDQIKERAITENEIRCVEAIRQMFIIINDHKDLPGQDLILKKRAVFEYIREISGLNAKQLTTTIASLKKHYRELKNSDEFGIF